MPASRLSKLLEGLGTQVEAAKRIGCSQASVSAWQRGEFAPSRMAVRAIAAATGLPVEAVDEMVAEARLVAPGPAAREDMGQAPCPQPTAGASA